MKNSLRFIIAIALMGLFIGCSNSDTGSSENNASKVSDTGKIGQNAELPSKQNVVFLGQGEMTHWCPMSQDLLFSSEAGKCFRCGMRLREISDKNKFAALTANKEIIRLSLDNMPSFDTKSPYNNYFEKSALFIGDDEKTFACPMSGDIVFSDSEGKCPRCGMSLKPLSAKQTESFATLGEKHEIIHVSGYADVSVEK